jgi:hypothetical protein
MIDKSSETRKTDRYVDLESEYNCIVDKSMNAFSTSQFAESLAAMRGSRPLHKSLRVSIMRLILNLCRLVDWVYLQQTSLYLQLFSSIHIGSLMFKGG